MKRSKWILYLGLLAVLSACGQANQVASRRSTIETSPTRTQSFTTETSALPEPQISLQPASLVPPSETSTSVSIALLPDSDELARSD